jgi:predicted  nucleic acid-binding Zn-ribbon protein
MATEPAAHHEGGVSPDGNAPLELLLDVQDLDTAISQLQHRKATLPERQELARLTASLTEMGRRGSEIQASRAELVDRQQALEKEISTAAARREGLEQRMYAARGTPARDLQAMDDEIRHLRQRRDQLEDAELEVMVALEPLDTELATLEARAAQTRAEAERVRASLASVEAEIDGQLAAQVAARESSAAGLPEDLRSRYESLRARLGGTGAARLVGSRCSGCHLELPSMEVDRIRHLAPGTIVTCEQCGRILVPAPSPAGA